MKKIKVILLFVLLLFPYKASALTIKDIGTSHSSDYTLHIKEKGNTTAKYHNLSYNGHTINAYCIEKNVSMKKGANYHAVEISNCTKATCGPSYATYLNNASKFRAIFRNSIPYLSLSEATANFNAWCSNNSSCASANKATIKDEDLWIAATQALIWHYQKGYSISFAGNNNKKENAFNYVKAYLDSRPGDTESTLKSEVSVSKKSRKMNIPNYEYTYKANLDGFATSGDKAPKLNFSCNVEGTTGYNVSKSDCKASIDSKGNISIKVPIAEKVTFSFTVDAYLKETFSAGPYLYDENGSSNYQNYLGPGYREAQWLSSKKITVTEELPSYDCETTVPKMLYCSTKTNFENILYDGNYSPENIENVLAASKYEYKYSSIKTCKNKIDESDGNNDDVYCSTGVNVISNVGNFTINDGSSNAVSLGSKITFSKTCGNNPIIETTIKKICYSENFTSSNKEKISDSINKKSTESKLVINYRNKKSSKGEIISDWHYIDLKEKKQSVKVSDQDNLDVIPTGESKKTYKVINFNQIRQFSEPVSDDKNLYKDDITGCTYFKALELPDNGKNGVIDFSFKYQKEEKVTANYGNECQYGEDTPPPGGNICDYIKETVCGKDFDSIVNELKEKEFNCPNGALYNTVESLNECWENWQQLKQNGDTTASKKVAILEEIYCCNENKCQNNEIKNVYYRMIDLKDAFPSVKSLGGLSKPWSEVTYPNKNNESLTELDAIIINNDNKFYVKNNSTIYSKTPEYSVSLSPEDMKKIRNYNSSETKKNAFGYSSGLYTLQKDTGVEIKKNGNVLTEDGEH